MAPSLTVFRRVDASELRRWMVAEIQSRTRRSFCMDSWTKGTSAPFWTISLRHARAQEMLCIVTATLYLRDSTSHERLWFKGGAQC
jgi:hypothetical protein